MTLLMWFGVAWAGFVTLDVAEDGACAANDAGDLVCWGPGLHDDASPRRMLRHTAGVAKITLGVKHHCFTDPHRETWCWGYNERGEVGAEDDGYAPPQVWPDAPMRATFGGDVRAVAVGYDHTCTLTSDGLGCWGSSRGGQLGSADDRHRGGTHRRRSLARSGW